MLAYNAKCVSGFLFDSARFGPSFGLHDLTFLLIDDHALFREGLALILKNRFPAVDVTEAAGLEEALSRTEGPEIVLLDLRLDGTDGRDGIGALKEKWPETKVIVVSALQEPEAIASVREFAAAYVHKSDPPQRIIGLIEELCPALRPPEGQDAILTERQVEVLRLVEQGFANKVIARMLGLSEFTVRGHVQAILKSLGVKSRSAAAFEARRRGLTR